MSLNWSCPYEELEAGQAFTTRGRTVTEADVVGFAALTGDWHPQHTDAEWAGGRAFGERIAHGLFVISLAAGSSRSTPSAWSRCGASATSSSSAPSSSATRCA